MKPGSSPGRPSRRGRAQCRARPFIIFASGKARARNDARYRPTPLDKDRQQPPSDGEDGARRGFGGAARRSDGAGRRTRLGPKPPRDQPAEVNGNEAPAPSGEAGTSEGTVVGEGGATPEGTGEQAVPHSETPAETPPPATAEPVSKPRRRPPPKLRPKRRRRPSRPLRPKHRRPPRPNGRPRKTRPPKRPRTRKTTKKALSCCPRSPAPCRRPRQRLIAEDATRDEPQRADRLDGDRPRRSAGSRRIALQARTESQPRGSPASAKNRRRLRASGARRRERRRLRGRVDACAGPALSRRKCRSRRWSRRSAAWPSPPAGAQAATIGLEPPDGGRSMPPAPGPAPGGASGVAAGGGGAGVGLSGFLAFALLLALAAPRAMRRLRLACLPVAHGVLRADSRATRLGPRPDRRPRRPAAAGRPTGNHFEALRKELETMKRHPTVSEVEIGGRGARGCSAIHHDPAAASMPIPATTGSC